MDRPELVPGLAGIPAAESAISYIDGQAGVLEYRGYRIEQLAEHSNFEETAWLLMHGELPTAEELAGLRKDLAAAREMPGGLVDILRAFPKDGHPMHALQSTVAALGMFDAPVKFGSEEDFRRAWIRLLAISPAIVATLERLRNGKDPLDPDPSLNTAGNFIWQMTGEKPDDLKEHILDVGFVLHADHTMNASTFAARVVYGTNASPYDSISGAIGALHGPLHGGANDEFFAVALASEKRIQIAGIDTHSLKPFCRKFLHEFLELIHALGSHPAVLRLIHVVQIAESLSIVCVNRFEKALNLTITTATCKRQRE